jgi:threonine/homoserine/homoserine lactone efflux protein
MTNEAITALLTFALVSSGSPGPNNIMLMSSGTNFGIKKSIPHALGVNLGFGLMIILVGTGLMEIFNIFPFLKVALKYVSITYLIYLSFKIASACPAVEETKKASKPFTFIQAALFQWINPKAWTMALTAITLYASSNALKDIIYVSLLYCLMNIPAVTTWVVLGKQMRKFLQDRVRLRIFNIVMGLLLFSSLYFVM